MSENQNKIQRLTVDEAQAGLRLDKWLSGADFIPSRARAQELIDKGMVTSSGRSLKASHRVQARQVIEIEMPAPDAQTLQPLNLPLAILHEDDDLIVIDKPAGLVVHPSAGHAQDTLVNILLHHVRELSMGFNETRPGIVHRLDRDTSGILVVAKNDFAHQKLADQFRQKTVHRIYWALIEGVPKVQTRTVRSYLGRHPRDRKRFASRPDGKGKLAVTHFKVLQSLPAKVSWIECRLETGRTHQIRVHLSESGHAVIGDSLYGTKRAAREAPRMALHACQLGFTHPRSAENLFFSIGWPSELAKFAARLGFKNV